MGKTPPEWTNLFTAEELEEFLALVRAWFEQEGYQVAIEGTAALVWAPGQEGQQSKYGLMNLAQMCRQSDRAEWREIVRTYFQGLMAARAEIEELKEKVPHFSEIRDLLVVRLWPAEYLDEVGHEHLIYRRDLEGTISVLAFDLPHSFRQVKPEEATVWGKSTEELFQIALQNVRKRSVPRKNLIEIEQGAHIFLLSDNSMLVTTHALLLKEHPECIGKGGALVGIPNRYALICHPIRDLTVMKAIHVLIPLIRNLYLKGPGSISPYLYWYHGGRFTNLPYRLSDEQLIFSPPVEFVELLTRLIT